MGPHLNGVNPRNLTVPNTFSTLRRVELDPGAQNIENMDFRLYGVELRSFNVSEPLSTPHLDESAPHTQDVENVGSLSDRVDPPNPTVSTPVSTTHLVEPDPGAQDVESTATDIQAVPPPGITVEEVDTTAASAQAPTIYRCDKARLDGNPCHATFASRGNLRKHQLASVHTRPVPCPFCPDGPWQPPSLLEHVKESHAEKLWTDFRCRICGSDEPYTLFTLSHHMSRHHGGLSTEER
jgi:hypothetical protein